MIGFINSPNQIEFPMVLCVTPCKSIRWEVVLCYQCRLCKLFRPINGLLCLVNIPQHCVQYSRIYTIKICWIFLWISATVWCWLLYNGWWLPQVCQHKQKCAAEIPRNHEFYVFATHKRTKLGEKEKEKDSKLIHRQLQCVLVSMIMWKKFMLMDTSPATAHIHTHVWWSGLCFDSPIGNSLNEISMEFPYFCKIATNFAPKFVAMWIVKVTRKYIVWRECPTNEVFVGVTCVICEWFVIAILCIVCVAVWHGSRKCLSAWDNTVCMAALSCMPCTRSPLCLRKDYNYYIIVEIIIKPTDRYLIIIKYNKLLTKVDSYLGWFWNSCKIKI